MRCRRASRLSSVRRGSGKPPSLIVVIERLPSYLAWRLVMPPWGQGMALGLWGQQLPQDLLQWHSAWTEGVAIVLDDAAQLVHQHFSLYVFRSRFMPLI